MEIRDKKGSENLVADHLSRLEYIMKEENKREVEEKKFPDEQLFMVNVVENTPWYADYVNYIVAKIIPWELSSHQRKKFFSEVRHYYWDEPTLFKHYADDMVWKCVPKAKLSQILKHCDQLILSCKRTGPIVVITQGVFRGVDSTGNT